MGPFEKVRKATGPIMQLTMYTQAFANITGRLNGYLVPLMTFLSPGSSGHQKLAFPPTVAFMAAH